jgi:hypothetical protein
MLLLRLAVLLLALLTAAGPALAMQPDEPSDPALEACARALSQELRCMVCQNQSIDDSDAPLARDLRAADRPRQRPAGARFPGASVWAMKPAARRCASRYNMVCSGHALHLPSPLAFDAARSAHSGTRHPRC